MPFLYISFHFNVFGKKINCDMEKRAVFFYTQFNSIINGKQIVCVIRPDRHYGTLQVNC